MPEPEMEMEMEKGAEKGADALQKMMKERFGDAKFGSLMNSIVDEMFKNMAEVKPSPNGPYAADAADAADALGENPGKPQSPS